MQKRSPWQRYSDGHAADFEAGGKTYAVIVTDAYVNARFRMSADRPVDRKCLIEDMEDEIAHLAGEKLKRGAVFQPLGKRPPQITLDSKDALI
jgi:hypothetical protein